MFWIFGDVFGDVFPHAVVSRSDLAVHVLAPEKKEEEGKYELENDDKELSIGLRIELIK